jgi:hypothetical protein
MGLAEAHEPCPRRPRQHLRIRIGHPTLQQRDPASVTVPALSNRSFQLIGTPSSSPRRTPLRARSPLPPTPHPSARSGVRTV